MPNTLSQYDEVIARMESDAEELERRAAKWRGIANDMRAALAEGEGVVQPQESVKELMALRLQTADSLLTAAEIVVRETGQPMTTPDMAKELRRHKYPYPGSNHQLSKSIGGAIRRDMMPDKSMIFKRIAEGLYALRNGQERSGKPLTSSDLGQNTKIVRV